MVDKILTHQIGYNRFVVCWPGVENLEQTLPV